jgi:hypothetical protein
MLGDALAETGWAVSKRHLELERTAVPPMPEAARVRSA